ncbi:MAG TPA: hypothetical protein VIJ59_01135 [Caulobacteraceae bacterium]
MKTIVLAALLLGGSAVAAHAESFTFKGTSTSANGVAAARPDGKLMTAGFSNGTGQTTMASGKVLATTSSCAGWSSQPADIFAQHGICTFSDATGAGTILFGCNPIKDPAEADCVGRLGGTGGAYAGRTGTITWHAKNSPDGKTGAVWGEGHWDD